MRTGRGVLFKGVAELASRAAGLITFPIMAQYVGAAGYGAYSQVNTIVGFIVPFASLGLGGAMVRFFSVEEWTLGVRDRFIRVTLLVILLAGTLSFLMSILAPMLNRLFLNWEEGTQLFYWGSWLIVLGAIEQVLLDFLRSRQKLVSFSLVQLIQTCMIVGATAVLLPSGYGLVELLQATIAIKLGAIFFMFLGFWAWDRPISGRTYENGVSIGRMIHFGLPLTLAGLGLWVMNFGDRLVIGHFLTPEALGIYGAVYALSSLLLAVNSPLNLPLYPRLMRATASGDAETVAGEVRMFHRYATLVLVPSAAFLLGIMNPLLLLMGGDAFSVDLPLVAMIVGAIFLDQWNAIAQYVIFCADQAAFSRNMWLIAGILNVIGNLFAVPLFGLHGAAFVTLTTFLLLEGVLFFKAREFIPLDDLYRWDVAWKASISSLVAIGVTLVLTRGGQLTIWGLFAFAIIFCVTYLCSMILLREVRKADLRVIVEAILKR